MPVIKTHPAAFFEGIQHRKRELSFLGTGLVHSSFSRRAEVALSWDNAAHESFA
jgi:hypothetical protein